MSRQRRSFTAKFKSDLVIELLKGEMNITVRRGSSAILSNSQEILFTSADK
ncbi:hypothetical protein HNP82_003558 [Catenibacillus scindens]|uniref:Transposase n=1 Tax=Catenibacillus scindens TaxID=673271 RepID=A0A7W8HDB9_9FIRM|nr:hypothetical protein [Catenibacillus scindens]